jgi:hypothetical protein
VTERHAPRAAATIDPLPWLALLPWATPVDLRFPIRRGDDRAILQALGADPLHAEVRKISYFESQDLDLMRAGVCVRATRNQRHRSGVAVGVAVDRHRDAVAEAVLGAGRAAGVEVEVEVSSHGVASWCLLGTQVTEVRLRGLLNGRVSLAEVLTEPQRTLLESCVGGDVPIGAVQVLPPVHVLTRSYLPRGYSRRLAAESWFPPDSARRLALATRCRPSSAPRIATETRRFLSARGIHLETDEARTTTQVAVRVALSSGPAPLRGTSARSRP